jgi:branched-chain amino acid transport system substrate-binding protein
MLQRVALLAALALSVTLAGPVRAAGEPINIGAILSLTGPYAFSGLTQAKTLGLVENLVNKQGGINGRPIKFVVTDDQSLTQVDVQLVSQLAAQNVPYVFGPGATATCAAGLPLVLKSGPVLWCSSPGLVAPPGSFGFASGPTLDDTLAVFVRYFRQRGFTRLGVIASTDGSGQAYISGLEHALALPENGSVKVVALERMNVSDISVAGQLTRIKAADPQVLLTLASGTPWGTIMRGVNDAGITIPIGGGNGNIVYTELQQFKSFLPKEVYFPGLLSLVPGAVGNGPVKRAQDQYFNAFKEAGLKPDLAYNLAWDPAMLLVEALRKLGPNATAQQLRDYFTALHGWIGINGVYDFRDGRQRGVGERALAIVRWDNEKGEFFPVSRAGGNLR